MDLAVMPRLGGLKAERFRLDAVLQTSRCDTIGCDIEER
jgi:hypothetical protein